MKQAVGWHALIPGPITGPEEALAFITGCGFCTWGPVPLYWLLRISVPKQYSKKEGEHQYPSLLDVLLERKRT